MEAQRRSLEKLADAVKFFFRSCIAVQAGVYRAVAGHRVRTLRPNVRVKPDPAVKRQARAADDDMHCSAGLAFCRWGSA